MFNITAAEAKHKQTPIKKWKHEHNYIDFSRLTNVCFRHDNHNVRVWCK